MSLGARFRPSGRDLRGGPGNRFQPSGWPSRGEPSEGSRRENREKERPDQRDPELLLGVPHRGQGNGEPHHAAGRFRRVHPQCDVEHPLAHGGAVTDGSAASFPEGVPDLRSPGVVLDLRQGLAVEIRVAEDLPVRRDEGDADGEVPAESIGQRVGGRRQIGSRGGEVADQAGLVLQLGSGLPGKVPSHGAMQKETGQKRGEPRHGHEEQGESALDSQGNPFLQSVGRSPSGRNRYPTPRTVSIHSPEEPSLARRRFTCVSTVRVSTSPPYPQTSLKS